MKKIFYPMLGIGFLFSFVLMMGVNNPVSFAQFATNTPVGEDAPTDGSNAPALFATNTPAGDMIATTAPISTPLPSETPMPTETLMPTATNLPTLADGPQDLLDQYALRLWQLPDSVALLLERVNALSEDDDDALLALRLFQYEVLQRFPNLVDDTQARLAILKAMVDAPRGTTDMRPFARQLVIDEINRRGALLNFSIENFAVSVTSLNLNNDGVDDALVTIQYPATATTLDEMVYLDNMLVVQDVNSGNFARLAPNFDLPAYPFDTIQAYEIIAIGDVNRDNLDEVAIELTYENDVNKELFILGQRNNLAINLVSPDEALRYGEIVSWDWDDTTVLEPILDVRLYEVATEKPNWECENVAAIEWEFTGNFYRTIVDPLAPVEFTYRDTLGCTLLQAEPLFNQDTVEAISTVESALETYATDTNRGRAQMVLAALYAIDGRLDAARTLAEDAQNSFPDDRWVMLQANGLLNSSQEMGVTGFAICEAMARFSPSPACGINDLLDRYLGFTVLTTDDELETQFTTIGLTVSEQVVISELGKADRTVIRFAFPNSGWWGFRAESDGTYTAERAETPDGFDVETFPLGFIEVPTSAFETLLVNQDPVNVINIIDNLERNNPDTPLDLSARYLRTLSHDLAGNRAVARAEYYELWSTNPEELWGKLAAQHLELR